MSRARHEAERMKKADGGKVEPDVKPVKYNAQDSNVMEEAEEKKRGGRAKKRRGGMIQGEETRERLDRPKKKSGGRVGSDQSPLSSASKVKDAEDHDASEGNALEGP